MMASRTTTDFHKGYPLTDLLTYQGTLRNTYGFDNIGLALCSGAGARVSDLRMRHTHVSLLRDETLRTFLDIWWQESAEEDNGDGRDTISLFINH